VSEPATELRFAFIVDDYETALRVFRDALGLDVIEEFDQQGGRGVLLSVPAATLEIFDVEHGRLVDEIEVGHPLHERVRVAVRVGSLEQAGREVAAAGAEVVADPVDTPWGDHNRRWRIPGAMQLTLFQSA